MTADAKEPWRTAPIAATWIVISPESGPWRWRQRRSRCSTAGDFELQIAEAIDPLVETVNGMTCALMGADVWKPYGQFGDAILQVQLDRPDLRAIADRVSRLIPAAVDQAWAKRTGFGEFHDSYPNPDWRARAAGCRLEAQL